MSVSQPPEIPEGHGAAHERYGPGDVVHDKYRLVRTLGQGGFGTVWVAHNTVLEVHVALKLIELDEDERTVQGDRLLEEARAAAQLNHPSIVRVFDFGRTGLGDPFVVMELLSGESLYDRYRRKSRLSAAEAVKLLLPIADALSAAHAKGIIHRDVKPENVVLAEDESGRVRPKLLDFGIARRIDVDRKLTAKGSVVGTPDYMSPEQARGETDVDDRADVWSLCVVLYELICGQVPFGGPNYNALLWAIIESPPTPITTHAAGDEALWTIIEKGLRKLPAERWSSMRELGQALAGWLIAHGIGEDASGTSLKAAWLEPSGPSIPPPSRSGDTLAPPSAQRSPTLSASIADTSLRPARRRYLGIAVALGLVVVAGAGFVTVRGLAARQPAPSVEVIEPSGQAAAAIPTGPTPMPVVSVVKGPDPEPAASASAPTPESEAEAGAPASKAAPAWRPKKRKKPVDFGF
jgi:serine/threonine protein kinase